MTLEWVMAKLLQHLDIMKCAQAELDNIVGTNRLVEESNIQNLPYLLIVQLNLPKYKVTIYLPTLEYW
jgi:hypothetical protein